MRTLELSNTIELAYPSALAAVPLYLSSTGFFIVQGKLKNHPFDAMISRKMPTTLATPKSAQRFWEENRVIANTDKNSVDLGCLELRSGSFDCRRSNQFKATGKEKAYGSDQVVQALAVR